MTRARSFSKQCSRFFTHRKHGAWVRKEGQRVDQMQITWGGCLVVSRGRSIRDPQLSKGDGLNKHIYLHLPGVTSKMSIKNLKYCKHPWAKRLFAHLTRDTRKYGGGRIADVDLRGKAGQGRGVAESQQLWQSPGKRRRGLALRRGAACRRVGCRPAGGALQAQRAGLSHSHPGRRGACRQPGLVLQAQVSVGSKAQADSQEGAGAPAPGPTASRPEIGAASASTGKT